MTPASSSRPWVWVGLLAALLVLAGAGGAVFYFQGGPDSPPPPPPGPPEVPTASSATVHTFCGACHAYPPAETFPRKYWRAEVERGYRFFERSGMPLQAPPIEGVVRYYEERAPEELSAAVFPPDAGPPGVAFQKAGPPGPPVPDYFAVSNVSLVRLPRPAAHTPGGSSGKERLDLLACDMQAGFVMVLRPYEPSPKWEVIAKVRNPARAQVVDLDGDGIRDLLVADLGNFLPTDRHCGSVVWLRGRSDGTYLPVTLLKDVGRVADVQAADFRGTGKLDLIVSVFGWQSTGELLYLENRTTDWAKPEFVARVLDERHGAIHTPIDDLDGDGRPDFVTLFAQEHECVVAFLNQGGGKFRKKSLYEAPQPGYGSSSIQLADLDGDGKRDVLYTNGDILDEPYLFKPYHSVQWLRNRGGLEFEHRPLTPMYGVHCAAVGDVTGDGRQDIIAVSFLPEDKFPARGERKPEALVILEQVAPGKFERHVLEKTLCDHVTCAIGDVYGTGRLDLVVGNFGPRPTKEPVTIWKNLGPSGAKGPPSP
jgi:hypothetical protein